MSAMRAFLLWMCYFQIYPGLMKWDALNKIALKRIKVIIFKLLLLSYMSTTICFSFYHTCTNSFVMLYLVHTYIRKSLNLQIRI